MKKSPGYPYYYKYTDKQSALYHDEDNIRSLVDRLLSGDETTPSVFALAEKSELRPKEKVLAGKTRVFAGSDMHHLLASKILYSKQNMQLMDKRDLHPIPLGLQMPGPEFVSLLLEFKDVIGADLSGCDARFPLRLARSVKNIRHHFLPSNFKLAGHVIYCLTYCGAGAVSGGIYRIYNQKSGWENTAHDNSLMSWLSWTICNFELYGTMPLRSMYFCKFYNDDHLYKQLIGSVQEVIEKMKTYNIISEGESTQPQSPFEVSFLSHSLSTRFVCGFGDFVLASGNLPKLKSSMNWVKNNQNLTVEESSVAHLIGLRMCLFPWEDEFLRCDEILSRYLKEVSITPFIRDILPARFTEIELARLHTRIESVGFVPDIFSYALEAGIQTTAFNEVLKVVRRLIKHNCVL